MILLADKMNFIQKLLKTRNKQDSSPVLRLTFVVFIHFFIRVTAQFCGIFYFFQFAANKHINALIQTCGRFMSLRHLTEPIHSNRQNKLKTTIALIFFLHVLKNSFYIAAAISTLASVEMQLENNISNYFNRHYR